MKNSKTKPMKVQSRIGTDFALIKYYSGQRSKIIGSVIPPHPSNCAPASELALNVVVNLFYIDLYTCNLLYIQFNLTKKLIKIDQKP